MISSYALLNSQKKDLTLSTREEFSGFHKGQYIEIFTNGKPRADQPAAATGYQHFCLIVDDTTKRSNTLQP